MRKYLAVFKFNLKSELNFKVDYFFSLLSFAVHIFVFNALWDYILQGKAIAGYSKNELIWYIIVGEFIMYSIGKKNYIKISDMIKNGDVANILTKFSFSLPLTQLIFKLTPVFSFIILAILVFSASLDGFILDNPFQTTDILISTVPSSLMLGEEEHAHKEKQIPVANKLNKCLTILLIEFSPNKYYLQYIKNNYK